MTASVIPALTLLIAGATALAASPVPTPIGVRPAFHPPPAGAAVRHGRPVAGLACSPVDQARVGAHLELFANGRVVIVPAGVGIAPPVHVRGPYVLGGRCTYPARTREPTGVIELVAGRTVTLGAFFRLWGQPLGPRQLAGFDGRPVRTYVNGRLRRGDPRTVHLGRHDQVVLQVGRYVPPHASYHFQKGL